MNKTLATAAAAAITGAAAYSIITWRHISTIDTSNVSFTDSNPDSFQTSESVTSIINPKGHVSANDSRSITVKPHHSHTDEVILARFMNGFFGGYVFAIERTILRTMRLNLVNFSSLEKYAAASKIWSASELSKQQLPPVHSILFGAFQVIDRHIAREGEESETHSYVDIAFGSDLGGFAGVHRFSIWRDSRNEKSGAVTIEFSHTSCNPTVDQPFGPDFIMSLHNIYAMLLFKEGIAKVLEE